MLVTGLLKIKFFKDITMSSLSQHTQILIKDLDFQAKHQLSHTQTDLMAYMVNVTYWADVVDGYYVIATLKILSDLQNLGKKNFEISLRALKEKGLIETKIVEVRRWKGKPKIRGIRLTEKGKLYHSNMVLPSQEPKVRELEKKNQELQETIDRLMLEKTEKIEKPQEKIQEPKPKPAPKSTPQPPKTVKIDTFIQEMRQHFGLNSQPICNFVPNFHKETTFYINSYNKLSIITPENDFQQIRNPQIINEFWQWLYQNPQRIGNKIDFSKAPTTQELKDRFVGRSIKIMGNNQTISNIIKVKNGVKINIIDSDGKDRSIINSDTQKDMIFEKEYCQKVILEILSS
jgi:DNA-binding PadR family transcriptional regulator